MVMYVLEKWPVAHAAQIGLCMKIHFQIQCIFRKLIGVNQTL